MTQPEYDPNKSAVLADQAETMYLKAIVSREDDPADVDEAYGAGTYARLFPKKVFQLRKNCEYIVEVEAVSEEEAWSKVPDNAEWQHSWSKTEIEEIG